MTCEFDPIRSKYASEWPLFYKAVALLASELPPEERRELGGSFFDEISVDPPPYDSGNIPLDLANICAMTNEELQKTIANISPEDLVRVREYLEEVFGRESGI